MSCLLELPLNKMKEMIEEKPRHLVTDVLRNGVKVTIAVVPEAWNNVLVFVQATIQTCSDQLHSYIQHRI